jgi:Bacterial regulatory proteins, gntR family
MQAAAKAREALKDVEAAARSEGSTEADAAEKAAAAHEADTQAIKRQRDALVELAAASKSANKETAFGGRDSMQQHLQDLDGERQRQDLLNRSKWGNYSSPQSWEAWQQQVYQNTILRNREARQGYYTPDQYLNYLDQERARTAQQTDAIRSRAAAVSEEASALQRHNDSLRQTHESAGTLGTTGTQNVQGYSAALAGLPERLTTHIDLDAQEATRDLTSYHLGLAATPAEVTTRAKLETGQFLAEMARVKGLLGSPGISAVTGPSQFTSGASAAAQRGLAEFYEQHTYGTGPSGMQAAYPARMLPSELAAAQTGMVNRGVQPGEQMALFGGPVSAAAEEVQATVAARPSEVAGQMALPYQRPHEELADRIREMIASGQYASGQRLPSMRVMGMQLGASQKTVGDALSLLHRSGDLTLGRGGLGVPAGPPQVPSIQVAGREHALTDISSVRAALTDLSRVIANPRIEVDPQSTSRSLQTVRGVVKEMGQTYSGLGGRPEGYGQVVSQLQQVQQQGVRAFDDVEGRGTKAADSVDQKWKNFRASVGDVFRGMAASAEDGAEGVSRSFADVGDRITAALKGISGGGIADVFKTLATAAAASGSATVLALSPMQAAFVALIQLLPALVAGFGALATVFASMPQTVVAIGTAFATLKMAIDPVMQALQAYVAVLSAMESAEANPLQTSMEMASLQNQLANAYYGVSQAAYQAMETQLTDAHAVADAQFSLQQAVVQSANAQVVAAQAVKDAQFELGQAVFEQGIQQVQSAMSVAEAQHSLQDAIFSTSQAQYQLDIAWQTAQEDLANLMIQVNYASVNLRGAQLGLEEAQQNYATTMANSNATALDRAMAAYQIQSAEEALAEQEQQNVSVETQLADVRKYGASQVFGVTQAQHALLDSQFAQVQASKQLMLTEKESADAQVQAAHAVEDAVFALKEAYFEQQQAAVTGAHSITDAQFGLSQAQIQQGEGFITSAHDQSQAAFELQQAIDQMALGLPSVASAEEELATAMFKLGPAARTAVLDLEPLAKWFVTNKSIGQAFFSQMLPSLGRIATILPPLSFYLLSVSGELGKLGNQAVTWFEKLATSPAWKVLTASTVVIIRNLGDAVGHVADGFTKLAIVAAPFTEWLTRGISKVAGDFDRWATNADKSGSNFHRWLTAVQPALHDVAEVVKAIVRGFSEIAGGPMGSPGSLDALHEFETLMHELSTTILPAFFTLMHALSSPAMTAAIIELFGAVTKLLLAIVNTPGFQAGFQLTIRLLTDFLNLVSWLMHFGAVSNVLGAIAGGLLAVGAALTVAKWSGLLTLINHFQTLVRWAKSAWEWIGKVTGLGGSGGGGESGAGEDATGADTFSETVTSAAETFAETVTAAGRKVAGDLEAGGAEAKTEESEGGALGGGEDAAGAGGIAGLMSTLLPVALPIIAAYFVDHQIFDLLGPKKTAQAQEIAGTQGTTGGAAAALGIAAEPGWMQNFGQWTINVGKFFSQTLPKLNDEAGQDIAGTWDKANTIWMNDVQQPVAGFFTQMLPTWLGSSTGTWGGLWATVSQGFQKNVWQPVSEFFGQGLPAWLTGSQQGWSGLWTTAQAIWQRDIVNVFSTFFGETVPSWFSGARTGWSGLWDQSWSYFNAHVISPTGDFLTRTLPGWFDDVGKWFQQKIGTPLGDFFTTTLPKTIENDFKNSINWVISNVINKAIGFVNDVTHIVGVPAIKKVQLLARGGPAGHDSVAGSGDEDSVHAMLTPGEFIIRKPARMAIDSQMGPGFLPALNSMQGYAEGGSVGGGGNPLTALVGDIGSFLGSAGKTIENLVGGGLKSVEGLLGKGAEALFDKVWSSAVSPMVTGVLGGSSDSMVGGVAQGILGSIKHGVDNFLASSGAGGPAPHGLTRPVASAQVAAEEAYALSQFGKYGWASNQMPYLIDNWNLESGWNPYADNPSSGAYGIPQSLPASKMGPLALPPVNSWVAQIDWGLNYIKGRYGSPEASDAHEHADHWYYTGGDVISAVKETTSNLKYREAMLIGAQLSSGLDPNFLHGQRHGAWSQLLNKEVTEAHAKDPYWMARYLLPRFEKGVEHYGWKSLPEDAAEAAALAEQVGSFYSKDGSAGVNAAWGDVLKYLGIKTQTSTPASGSGTQKAGGQSEATLWTMYTSQLHSAVLAARHAFDTLYGSSPADHFNEKSVDGVRRASADWAHWYAMALVLADQRNKSISDENSSYFSKIWSPIGTPLSLNEGMWSNLSSSVTDLERWEAGAVIPPRSAWAAEKTGHWPAIHPRTARQTTPLQKAGEVFLPVGMVPGSIQPTTDMMQKHQHSAWVAERAALLDVAKITAEAESAWKSLYGPGGSLVPVTVTGPAMPGPGTPPAAAYTASPNYSSAILAAVSAGGPAIPSYFQSGGSVEFPDTPRALSAAASSTSGSQRIGMQFNGDINVNNPLRATAEDSIAHQVNRLSFLHGRGVA